MPVTKFRTFDEAEAALWRDARDPDLPAAIDKAWAFSRQLCPVRFPSGVFKHRTIEDAERQREAWEQARVDQLRSRPERC